MRTCRRSPAPGPARPSARDPGTARHQAAVKAKATKAALTVGDIGYGLLGWANMIAILALLPIVIKVTRDYDRQRRAGLQPVFQPEELGIRGADYWTEARTRDLLDTVRTRTDHSPVA